MSEEVAPQGIAQDYVTLFVGIPMLVVSLLLYRNGSLRGKIILTGTLGYFLVTYLFFLMMAMYNELFPVWILILSFSFFAFILAFNTIDGNEIKEKAEKNYYLKFTGGFLMFTSVVISILW